MVTQSVLRKIGEILVQPLPVGMDPNALLRHVGEKGMAKAKPKAVVATVRAPSGQPLARMIAVPKPKPPKGKGK